MAKHTWSYADTYFITLSYKNGTSYKDISLVMPHLKQNSIRMKYKNCLYLEKGNVRGSLKNASKEHKKVWEILYKN